MSFIDVQNLTFGYEGSATNVFENASFRIDTDWKAGFVGRNGRGKTTFLKLLTGAYPYRGKISASVTCVYFPFAVPQPHRTTDEVMQGICPLSQEWERIRELSYLDVSPEILTRPYDTLSHGERTKVLLAGLFLGEDGRYALIDEPTDHLDAAGRAVLAAYLKRKRGFLLVSHDRAFLDGCVDHILSINRASIEVCAGNYSVWRQNFDRRQAYEAAQDRKLQKDIDKLAAAARQAAAWSDKVEASKYGVTSAGLKPDRGHVGHQAAKLMKRAKATQSRREKAIEQKSELKRDEEKHERLKMFPLSCRAERLLSVDDVSVSYDGKAIFPPVKFEVLRGERIAVEGGNGCGKSSLLKLVVGEPIPHTGTIATASGLILSYVPQSTAHLCGTLSAYAEAAGIDESLFRAVLDNMGFARAHFEGDISSFSQGQKKKVLLAKSLCERAHLYVWDEPLNFIDIDSRERIEQLLQEFAPAMLFVEHDAAFRAAVATRTVKL